MAADSLEALVAEQDDEPMSMPADPRLPDPRRKAAEEAEPEKAASADTAPTTVQVVPNIRKLKEKLLAKKAEAEGKDSTDTVEKPAESKDAPKDTQTPDKDKDDADDKKKKKKEKKEAKPGDHLNDSAASELLKAKLKAAKQLLKKDSKEGVVLAASKKATGSDRRGSRSRDRDQAPASAKAPPVGFGYGSARASPEDDKDK